MNPISFEQPEISFDDSFEQQLVALEAEFAAVSFTPDEGDGASTFVGYQRMLTPEGGILIEYCDIDRSLFIALLRLFAWTVATIMTIYLALAFGPLDFLFYLFAVFGLPGFYAYLVNRKIVVRHSVEIQPDRMVIDGTDVFLAREIGDNWPRLEIKDDLGDRAVIAGLAGTRFIEFLTANRSDYLDVTPELLEKHLHEAMEQLWDRREVSFAADD